MWYSPLLPAGSLLAGLVFAATGKPMVSLPKGGAVPSPAKAVASLASASLTARTPSTMAVVGTYTKQPWEAFRVSIDYKAHAGSGEISAISADITAPAGMQLIGQAVQAGVLQIYIGGGTDGQVYTWRVRSTLSTEAGELARVEDEFLVLVEDVVGDVGSPDGSFAGPGNPPSRIDQSEGDSRTYLISCASLLRPDELLTGITSLTPASGLTATGAVLRQGRYLEVVLSGTVEPSAAYSDRLLRADLATTKGSVRGAITMRVHAI